MAGEMIDDFEEFLQRSIPSLIHHYGRPYVK